MSDTSARIFGARPRPDIWSAAAAAIALVVLLPIASVIWMALNPSAPIWGHLASTTLPRYLSNSLVLMAWVGAIAGVTGTITAWLVVMYRFPGARWLEWALLMPLAVPAYVGAYALTDLLEYAGPVQTALRDLMGWQSARDYWFPEVRSRAMAAVILGATLYPYVYLLARAAFREQSATCLEMAQALGAGPWRRFWRVGLPMARPAIAAGMAIAMMEAVNDFGTVEYFGVQTLTTGIFTTWLGAGNAGGAAQIACVILALVLLLAGLERVSRRRARYHQASRSHRRAPPERLGGVAAWAATAVCAAPVAVGLVLPVGVLVGHAWRRTAWIDADLGRALGHTLSLGVAASLLTVAAALVLVYGARLARSPGPRLLLPVTTIGYAAPGAVLGVGLLIPLGAFDNRIADGVLAVTGWDPGLILTGSAAGVVLAYFVRFFAIGQGAVDAAMDRVSPSLPMAARALGRSAGGALRDVYVPMMRGSVATALLLVFVDCVKELPATLLLRPFNYNTLATRTYEQASLERLGDAAPAALLVTLVGALAVGVLARANR